MNRKAPKTCDCQVIEVDFVDISQARLEPLEDFLVDLLVRERIGEIERTEGDEQ